MCWCIGHWKAVLLLLIVLPFPVEMILAAAVFTTKEENLEERIAAKDNKKHVQLFVQYTNRK